MCNLFLSLLFLFQIGQISTDVNIIKPKQEIQSLIHAKETAVNRKDEQVYLSLFDIKDRHYLNEQKRWFQDAIHSIEQGSFRLQVMKIQAESKDLYRVIIKQTSRIKGKKQVITYPLLIRHTPEGWKDADFPFYTIRKEDIIVKYSHPNLKKEAKQVFAVVQQASARLNQIYPHAPHSIQVKLYHQPKWFRQSVKPSLPEWAGGWNESGESIKLIATVIDPLFLRTGIVHELTHQVVSLLTNDNAAYWLQEGAAMYYERHLFSQEGMKKMRSHSLYSLPVLEKLHLERLRDQQAAKYYLSCYHIFSLLIEKYGEAKIRQFFRELYNSPTVDQDSNQKMEITNYRTREAFRKVFGLTVEELH